MLAASPRLRDLVDEATARLTAAGVEGARADAEWLLAGILGIGRGALRLRLVETVDLMLRRRYEPAIRRRMRREPLQRILGWEEFRGLRLALTPAVPVPRPETELLVDLALAVLPAPRASRGPLIVDVGTGSGCIGCAIAAERPDARVVATDRSLESARVARDNARRLGLADRMRVTTGDLLDAVREQCADVIVSNPPYLPSDLLPGLAPEVRDHDPRTALDGGPDGLAVLQRLVAEAARALRPGGALVVETAGGAQALDVARRARDCGFTEVRITADLLGVERFVTGLADTVRSRDGRSCDERNGEWGAAPEVICQHGS